MYVNISREKIYKNKILYYLMIISPNLSIVKHAINGIIAPHGMTDIIHAQQHQLIPQLFKINGLTMLSSILLNKFHLQNVLNGAFVLASIIHFRRDFPKIKYIPRFLLSSIFLLFSLFYNPNIFYFYMLFIHVPNHYNLNWNYLQNKKLQTISTLSFSTTLFLIMGDKFHFLTYKPIVIDCLKGIIISHIIYEESFIFNELHKKQLYWQFPNSYSI